MTETAPHTVVVLIEDAERNRQAFHLSAAQARVVGRLLESGYGTPLPSDSTITELGSSLLNAADAADGLGAVN